MQKFVASEVVYLSTACNNIAHKKYFFIHTFAYVGSYLQDISLDIYLLKYPSTAANSARAFGHHAVEIEPTTKYGKD